MARAKPVPRYSAELRWPRLRRSALWAGLGAAALALGAVRNFSQNHLLLVNASPSLSNWAFWVERHKRPLHGDYVFFDPPRSALLIRHFGKKPRLFGKHVMGIPGDIVSREGSSVLVNGRVIRTRGAGGGANAIFVGLAFLGDPISLLDFPRSAVLARASFSAWSA